MRRVRGLVAVSAVAACWLVVLTAQLPAQQAPDPIRAAFRALGASQVRTLRLSGFGATYTPTPGQSPSRAGMGRRVALKDYVADIDYTAPAMRVQPRVAAEGFQRIWATPHGFLKAASGNGATTRTVPLGTEVRFSAEGRRYVGILNEQHMVDRVQTWADGPVRGDVLVETFYRDYERHGAVMFPRHITQHRDGLPALDVWVATVDVNRAVVPGSVGQ